MIVTISGPSCAGKTTLLEGLRGTFPSVTPMESVTTRPARPSDQPGEYRYVTNEEFDRLNAQGMFAWIVQPFGGLRRYGTRALLIESALQSKQLYMPILTVDTVGTLSALAKQLQLDRRLASMYLGISDAQCLRERFKARGDAEEELHDRIVSAMRENFLFLRHMSQWNHHQRYIDGLLPKQEVLAQAVHFIQSLR